jgi:hypothetical protein
MVELDDYLTGSPIQHRECQNHESERFLSYFKQRGGIKYTSSEHLLLFLFAYVEKFHQGTKTAELHQAFTIMRSASSRAYFK